MRQHHTPRAYLRHFSIPSDTEKIWQYDKQQGCFVKSSINNAAVYKDAYPEDIERELAEIEDRAGDALRKLRDGDDINLDERMSVVDYVVTMTSRGPARWKRIEDYLQRAEVKLLEDLDTEFEGDPKAMATFRGALHSVRSDPKRYGAITRHVYYSSGLREAFNLMEWNIFAASHGNYYLTSDNPVYINRGASFEDCEIIVPLSSRRLLYARQGQDVSVKHVLETDGRLDARCNRLTATHAYRFIYCESNERWIHQVAKAGNWMKDKGITHPDYEK